MIRFTEGNLLEADVEALVNTVNTMGVMGKGIALMFKERFPENYRAYASACKNHQVELGKVFVTELLELGTVKWIINFPTKANWRFPSRLQWIESGLTDLRKVIDEKQIKSIALPPLGSGNGGLNWRDVRPVIERALADLPGVDVRVYEPTGAYQNVTKTTGVEQLTPARAIIAELVRRYEVLWFDCSILEVQKLAWVVTRVISRLSLVDPLNLKFVADRYGPYADGLRHLLENLDGSYLHSERRISDTRPSDVVRFSSDHAAKLSSYLKTAQAAAYLQAIERTDQLIDGFQSPLGMECLSTVDWLLVRMNAEPTLAGLRTALNKWPTDGAAERKQRLFSDKLLQAALDRAIGLS